MKIIFLDFDGVLNSHRFLLGKSRMAPKDHIDPAAVQLLNELIESSGAKVVVSSTWRLMYSRLTLELLLREHDFKGEIIGVTVDAAEARTPTGVWMSIERGHEIQHWLDNTKEEIEGFVIFDDAEDMAHLAPKLVRTTFDRGLEKEHIERALEVLNEPVSKEEAP